MLGKALLAATLLAGVHAQSTAPEWGQCGGQGWTGATTCPSGWACIESNEYYSQCLQSAGGVSTVAPTASPTISSPVSGPTQSIPSGTATAGSDGPTLLPNNLWIRADEDPDFHTYLQSAVSGQPGPAVFGNYQTAAQFVVTNGQTEQILPDGSVLYLNVNMTTLASGATYLPTFFATTPDTAGTWSFSGDGLNWVTPSVSRPNTGAFLACGDGVPSVNVNLGAYDYMTPAGCADETLNYYNGATPVD